MRDSDYIEKIKNKKIGSVSILSVVTAVYLFLTLNPFFTWILPFFIIFIPFLSVILVFTWILFENKSLVFTKRRMLLSFTIIFYAFYTAMPLVYAGNYNVKSFLYFILLALTIVYFPTVIFERAFLVFRKIMIVFSIASIVLFVLLFLRIDLPFYKMPVTTAIIENTNHYYRLYGIVVSSTNSVFDVFGFYIARMCGPFYEPGHYAIYLGFTLCFEKYLLNKTSPILVIAGFLTFSSAFIFIFLLIMLYDVVFNKQFKSLTVFLVTLTVLFSVILTNSTTRELVYYITIGRNFENLNEDVLDDRGSTHAKRKYRAFVKTNELWTGIGAKRSNETGILSDYRGFILTYGILGIFISFLLSIQLFVGMNKKLLFLLLSLVILVFAHRAWMFYSPYIYVFLLMGVLFSNENKYINIDEL